MNFKSYCFALSLVLAFTAFAAHAQTFETVYGRKADVSILNQLSKLKNLKEVVAEMEKTSVKFYKVKDTDMNQGNPKQSYFHFLPDVPDNLVSKLEEQIKDTGSEAALFISWNDICDNCTNIILISETANPMTLFHEFTHHLFEIQNRKDTLGISKNQEEFKSFLRIYNRRIGAALFDEDAFRLRNWRENFDGYVDDYSKTFDVIQGRMGSEEVAIEVGLLKIMSPSQSPFFDLIRARQGIYVYSQQSVINGLLNRIDSTYAFMDKLKSSAHQSGSDITSEEEKKRDALYETINARLENFKKTKIKALQYQLNEAKSIIESLEKK